MSGNNYFGHATAGFRYSVNSSQMLELNYSVGNSGRGNSFLSAFYSFNF